MIVRESIPNGRVIALSSAVPDAAVRARDSASRLTRFRTLYPYWSPAAFS